MHGQLLHYPEHTVNLDFVLLSKSAKATIACEKNRIGVPLLGYDESEPIERGERRRSGKYRLDPRDAGAIEPGNDHPLSKQGSLFVRKAQKLVLEENIRDDQLEG